MESIQNLHNCIKEALHSFEELFKNDGLDFDYLRFAGKFWKVKLKFGIAFVIGDTELHDKLCGRYCNIMIEFKCFAGIVIAQAKIS